MELADRAEHKEPQRIFFCHLCDPHGAKAIKAEGNIPVPMTCEEHTQLIRCLGKTREQIAADDIELNKRRSSTTKNDE